MQTDILKKAENIIKDDYPGAKDIELFPSSDWAGNEAVGFWCNADDGTHCGHIRTDILREKNNQ